VATQDNFYAPPRASVADVVSSEPFELASRGSRLGAAMLDGICFLIPLVPVIMLWVAVFMRRANAAQEARSLGPFMALGGLLVLGVVIYDLVLLYRNGQTIGKKLCGIKIVRTNGARASLARIFWLRGFVNGLPGAIPLIGRFYALVDILFIFGNARRCVHDYIADTIVVKA
jgi:uncharacterized RDD family membrane protein YckC